MKTTIMSIINNMRHNKTLILLWVLLCAVFALSVRYDFAVGPHTLVHDIASDSVVYAKTVFDHGLFFNGWFGSNEPAFNRPVWLLLLVHLFVKSWINAAIITFIIGKIVLLFMLGILMRNMGFNFKHILISWIFILCCDFHFANSFNGGSAYTMQQMLAVILLALITYINIRQGKHKTFNYCILLLTSFICGFFGMKMVAATVIPMLIVPVQQLLIDEEGSSEIDYGKIRKLWFPFLNFAVAGIGYILLVKYNSIAHEFLPISLTLSNVKGVMERLPEAVNTIFLLFGVDAVTVYSFGSTLVFVEIALRMTLLIICIFMLYKALKGKIKSVELSFVVLFFWTAFILMFILKIYLPVNAQGVWHYFFFWILIAISPVVLFDKEGLIKTKLYRYLGIVVIVVLCILSLYNNNIRVAEQYEREPRPVYAEIGDYLITNGYEGICSAYEHNASIAVWTNMELKYYEKFWDFTSDHTNSAYFKPATFLVDTNAYYNIYYGKWAIVLSDAEIVAFEANASTHEKEKFALANQVARIEQFNIYEMSFNPLNLFKMPAAQDQSKMYYFSDTYVFPHISTQINYLDRYLETSTQGLIVYGPYTSAKKGNYNLTVSYEYIEYNGDATIQVYSRSGQEIHIQPTELPQLQTELQLSLQLSNDANDLEFTVVNTADSRIRLYSIEVTKSE
jgi:hypothetical protein